MLGIFIVLHSVTSSLVTSDWLETLSLKTTEHMRLNVSLVEYL